VPGDAEAIRLSAVPHDAAARSLEPWEYLIVALLVGIVGFVAGRAIDSGATTHTSKQASDARRKLVTAYDTLAVAVTGYRVRAPACPPRPPGSVVSCSLQERGDVAFAAADFLFEVERIGWPPSAHAEVSRFLAAGRTFTADAQKLSVGARTNEELQALDQQFRLDFDQLGAAYTHLARAL
jgi:hypothetical protein